MDDGDPRREIEELRAAHTRLVATADAERRRIERDLHDGVQQHLVALAVNLQLARQLADTDLSALRTQLDEIGRDVHAALDDVRRLAARVYPASLLARGPVDALRTAASETVIPTRVEGPRRAERYSAEVEAAAYFCCLEALEAAAPQQPSGERATVRLHREQDDLVFDVIIESGPPRPWTERDLIGIADRLGAVDGRLATSPDTGQGACLSGRIPIAP